MPTLKLEWHWDIKFASNPNSFKLTNSNRTIEKVDYTGANWLFSNVGLIGPNNHWEIKLESFNQYNECIMGICEKDKRPLPGSTAFSWT